VADRLVDSNLWIDFSLGNPLALKFFAQARSKGEICTSVLCVMEVVLGAESNKDQERLEKLFATARILPVEADDSWQGFRILRSLINKTGIGAVDSILAATALRHELTFCTLNERDFRGIHGLKVERPY
jgi:tRNA(fMet)-specific endonuclease VapC